MPLPAIDQRSPVLRMANVDKVFGGSVQALSGMSLNINEGDFISLLGPSGCKVGKVLQFLRGAITKRLPAAKNPPTNVSQISNGCGCLGSRWTKMSKKLKT